MTVFDLVSDGKYWAIKRTSVERGALGDGERRSVYFAFTKPGHWRNGNYGEFSFKDCWARKKKAELWFRRLTA